MDEYIKREDALDAVLFALVGTGLQSRVISAVRDVNAADVVPKSEVEEAVEKLMSATDKVICEAKAEVAREIFEEIEKIDEDTASFQEFYSRIMKLKKKYTEEKDDNRTIN